MRRLVLTIFLVSCAFLGLLITVQSSGQESSGDATPALNFGGQFDPDSLGGVPVGDENLKLSSKFKIEEGSRKGVLSITAKAAPGWHTYSRDKEANEANATRLKFKQPGGKLDPDPASPHFKLLGKFKADHDPEPHEDTSGKTTEIFHEVTWSVGIELLGDTKPEDLTIDVVFDGTVCTDGPGGCIPYFDTLVPANFTPETQVFEGKNIKISGRVSPKVAAPGDTVKLEIIAEPAEHWHIYEYRRLSPNRKEGNQPTLIVLTKTGNWKASQPKSSSKAIKDSSGTSSLPYHENLVRWTIDLKVPSNAKNGTHTVEGSIGYQVCNDRGSCLPLSALAFSVQIPVAEKRIDGEIPVLFSTPKGLSYSTVHKQAEEFAATPDDEAPGESALAGVPVVVVLLLGLIAGFILNLMPCVLPVIGLKVMSFVQQAGESRARIFSLNAWFSLGLMSVFWVVAAIAVGLSLFFNQNLKWGEQFTNPSFVIPLSAIVFVFALSFLGVWEIPIPGFVGTEKVGKMADQEGAAGAFSKGVLATILATPCTGPLLGPVIGWAATAPAWLTFAGFTAIGFGMALPYLLIGAFPKLIKLLPKPGAWMETFKKVMGFVLLLTVVWLFYVLRQADVSAKDEGGGALLGGYLIESLILMVVIGFACWIIGKTPLTSELSVKLRAWGVATVIVVLASLVLFGSGKWVVPTVAIICGGSLAGWLIIGALRTSSVRRKAWSWGGAAIVLAITVGVMYLSQQSTELAWQSFSRATLEEHREKKQTVLVDFTADW